MDEDQDQPPIIANIEGLGQLHFPAGTDPSVVDAAVAQAVKDTKIEHFMKGQKPPPSMGDVAEMGPIIGGAIGGAVGNVPGALVGGMYGALGRDLARAGRGDPRTPRTPGAAADSVSAQGIGQAALTTGGNILGDTLIPILGNAMSKLGLSSVSSAVKAPWSAMTRRAQIEGIPEPEVLKNQAQFLIDHQLAQPAQATQLKKVLGRMVQEEAGVAETLNPQLTTDTAERLPTYLNKLGREIENRTDPGAARQALQNYGRRIVEDSPLSRSTYVAPPPETLEEGLVRGMREGVTAAENAGKRATAPTTGHQFTTEGGAFPGSSRPRELRTDLKPSELLPIIRAKSVFAEGAHPTEKEAARMGERAVRDSFKEAVPSSAPILRAQGLATDAETLLNRQAWRDANRDTAPGGLGMMLGAASGRPSVGLLLQMLKGGQLRGGLAAGKYGPELVKNAPTAGAAAEQLARVLQLLLTGGAQQPPQEP